MSSGGHNKIKECVEDTRQISITDMQELGTFKSKGKNLFSTTWKRGGKERGSMGIEYYSGNNYVTAVYTITHSDTGAKEDRRDRINLGYVKAGYGKRAYFVCPSCGKLRTSLSFVDGEFKCRKCARLNYYSSQMNHDSFTKPDSKIKNILRKLKHNCGNILSIGHVPKPKKMRDSTYTKLMWQLHYWLNIRTMAMGAMADDLRRVLKKYG